MMMNYLSLYKPKLTTPDEAIRLVPSQGTLSMGMAVSELSAFLKVQAKKPRYFE